MLNTAYYEPFEHEDVPQLASDLMQIADRLIRVSTSRSATGDTSFDDDGMGERRVSHLQAAKMLMADRKKRDKEFLDGLFADPAWDILLDLFAAGLERKPVSVTSAALAARVPTTTAYRCLQRMEFYGLIWRLPDPTDKRRTHLGLSDAASCQVGSYIAGVVARWGFTLIEAKQ